jgi:hypothetical protein
MCRGSEAISFGWQRDRVSQLLFDVGLPGDEGAYPHRQLFQDLDMSECLFWTSDPVKSLSEAIMRGVLHRSDGPAINWHRRDGSLANEQWWFLGRLHRFEDEASFITYSESGLAIRRLWAAEGVVFKEIGAL